MANDTSRIKDLAPTATASDSDIFALDGENGTMGISFEDLSDEIIDRYVASIWEIKQYLNI